jgi:hypothetical protein
MQFTCLNIINPSTKASCKRIICIQPSSTMNRMRTSVLVLIFEQQVQCDDPAQLQRLISVCNYANNRRTEHTKVSVWRKVLLLHKSKTLYKTDEHVTISNKCNSDAVDVTRTATH